ncbi:MAG: CAP domain-containing protein [Candidatus Thiodiazotropha sp.]
MKHPGTYFLLLAILIGCLAAPSLSLSYGHGDKKVRTLEFPPVVGRVARSYEERDVHDPEHGVERVTGDEVRVLGQCEITTHQQEMLRLVNRARARQRDCGGEIYRAAPPLRWSCRLHEAAVVHSQDMIDYDFFDHQGSDGSTVGMRVTRFGYEWRAVGENIAAGYPGNEAVMDNLLSSPIHCENIMDPKFREFGSAVIATDQAHYDNYWTQVFGRR